MNAVSTSDKRETRRGGIDNSITYYYQGGVVVREMATNDSE